jgi:hypothetical protein
MTDICNMIRIEFPRKKIVGLAPGIVATITEGYTEAHCARISLFLYLAVLS